MACDFVTAHGFNGHLLKAELRKKNKVAMELVTVAHSKECVETYAKASMYSAAFPVMGGDQFTSDNLFKTAGLSAKRDKIEELKKSNKG